MAFGDFTLQRVRDELGVRLRAGLGLFAAVPPAPVPPSVEEMLRDNLSLAVATNTEKARSELLIAPLLAEAWRQHKESVALWSGVSFPADPGAGLTGVCDFILGRPPQLPFIVAPALIVVEAKNEDVMGGLGQCAAAMVGARRFNAAHGDGAVSVHGCVTNGAEWKFLRLDGDDLRLDDEVYQIGRPERILGVVLHAVGLNASQ